MTDLQKQFQEEKGESFDGIPINGVHLEYITWLEARIQALRIHDVSNSDEYTRGYRAGWRDCCKDVKEFG